MTRLDFRRSLEFGLRSRSAGSFPEQRLVIKPKRSPSSPVLGNSLQLVLAQSSLLYVLQPQSIYSMLFWAFPGFLPFSLRCPTKGMPGHFGQRLSQGMTKLPSAPFGRVIKPLRIVRCFTAQVSRIRTSCCRGMRRIIVEGGGALFLVNTVSYLIFLSSSGQRENILFLARTSLARW